MGNFPWHKIFVFNVVYDFPISCNVRPLVLFNFNSVSVFPLFYMVLELDDLGENQFSKFVIDTVGSGT